MDFSVGLSVDQNLARAGCHFDNSMAPMTSIASIFRHSSVQTTTICVRIPLPLWIFCIPRPDKGDNGGAAQQMRTANADAWTMAMAQGPKVPSAASSASSAHRPPPTARTSVEHGADGKAQNNSQRPRVQVGACLKLSWRVPPPPRKHQPPPPPAWPGQNQTRVAVVWLAVTALFMFKGSCPGVRKRAAPGVIQRHACGQASPTSRVPKSPCWRWLHGAGIFGESRENPKASWKHHELPNMSILDPKSGKSC